MCDDGSCDASTQAERDYQDREPALEWAETEGLRKKGRKWLLTKLWQQQTAANRLQSALDLSERRRAAVEAELIELRNRTEPMITRNRQLNSALHTVQRALQQALPQADD